MGLMKLLNGWRTNQRRNRNARIAKKATAVRQRLELRRREDETRMPRRDSDHNGSTGPVSFTCR